MEMTLEKLKQIKISEHFKANEIFFSTGISESTISNQPKLQRVQIFLVGSLCNNILETIREIANTEKENSIVKILGGCRNKKSHLNMFNTNWIPPSSTSDHSYMNPYYPLGVGAADFYIPGFTGEDMKWLFEKIIRVMDKRQFGQIIFYPESNSKFIHISNPKSILGAISQKIQITEPNKKMIYKNGNFSTYRKSKVEYI